MRKIVQRLICYVLLAAVFSLAACMVSHQTVEVQTTEATKQTENTTEAEKTQETTEMATTSTSKETTILLNRDDWSEDVKENINKFLTTYGKNSPDYPKNHYVVFDFDNTTAIYDVEHLLVAYQLETMTFAVTPDKLEEVLTFEGYDHQNLIDDIVQAYDVLYEMYGPFKGDILSAAAQDAIHDNMYWKEFSAKMLKLFQFMNDADKSVSCLFPLVWFTDMSKEQVYDLAYSCYKTWGRIETETVTWSSPEELPSKAGKIETAFVKGASVTNNMYELYYCLHEAGIDVYVCSASGTIPVQAAIDAFGLRDFVTGMTGMNLKIEDGKLTNLYDYEGTWYYPEKDGWVAGTKKLSAMPIEEGKTTVILQGLYDDYDGGPIAGFMDSMGDFNFCTSFASLKMVLCLNIANKKTTDPAFWVAATALYERDVLDYDLISANKKGETLYLLQGRNENGYRTFINGNATIKLGYETPILFLNEENETYLAQMKEHMPEIKDILGAETYHSIP